MGSEGIQRRSSRVSLSALPIDFPMVLAALGAVAAGAMVQAWVGIGLAMIAAPLLLLLEPAFVPGPLLAAAAALTALMAWRDRHAIDVRGLKYALAGRVAGTIPAMLLVSRLSRAGFDLVFGSLVLLAVFLSTRGRSLSPTPNHAIGAGALSGLMATLSSIGGPPMALLYQNEAAARVRGTLSSFFVIGASMSIAALALVGRFGRVEVLLSLLLIPGVVVGYWVSGLLATHVEHLGLRPAILLLSLGTALVVLARAVL